MNTPISSIHPDLLLAQQIAYNPHDLIISHLIKEPESAAYGACTFELNNKRILFRVAKTTPTKIGQFVTLWKRVGNSPIMPFDITDPIDYVIIMVRKNNCVGQFIFPPSTLLKHDIISHNNIGGKRAMRVYAPWDVTDNSQAKKTQKWQLNYFVEFQPHMNVAKLKQLLA